MTEYMPHREEVKLAYIHANMGATKSLSKYEFYGLAFDRMIAEVERAAAEKAWDEGVADEQCSREYGETPDNPYRRNEGENE